MNVAKRGVIQMATIFTDDYSSADVDISIDEGGELIFNATNGVTTREFIRELRIVLNNEQLKNLSYVLNINGFNEGEDYNHG